MTTTGSFQLEKFCPGCGSSRYVYNGCGLCGKRWPEGVVLHGGQRTVSARDEARDVVSPEEREITVEIQGTLIAVTWLCSGAAYRLRMEAEDAGRLAVLLQRSAREVRVAVQRVASSCSPGSGKDD